MTQAQLFDLKEAQNSEESLKPAYRVLARKYRPQKFSDLHGQDVLVQVLTNGLQSGRLPHAFIFTGIRGVGKTTTARLLARSLNCTGRDIRQDVNPCGSCESCLSIAQDRHIDVIEMDAASRTGIEDIREIIEAAKYKAVSARYKVYIIDEVHMLSKSAFNALLKTLEEPPEHVKFIFATTEIRKVPKTVLSRCMRFDLARIDQKTLVNLLTEVAKKEGFALEERACQLLARAADGSARDGKSLLDQALTLSQGTVTTKIISDMLGLADRQKIFTLYRNLIDGKATETLKTLQQLHQLGVEPLAILNDLLDLTHALSSLKVAPDLQDSLEFPETEIKTCMIWAQELSFACLTRVWQVILKGIQEVQQAPHSMQACRMILLRVVYMASLPSPEEILQKESQTSIAIKKPSSLLSQSDSSFKSTSSVSVEKPIKRCQDINSFKDILDLAFEHREPLLAAYLQHNVHLVHFEPQKIALRPGKGTPEGLLPKLAKHLREWTGQIWQVIPSEEEGSPSLAAQQQQAQQELIEEAKKHPLVEKTLETFPGAKIESVNQIEDLKT